MHASIKRARWSEIQSWMKAGFNISLHDTCSCRFNVDSVSFNRSVRWMCAGSTVTGVNSRVRLVLCYTLARLDLNCWTSWAPQTTSDQTSHTAVNVTDLHTHITLALSAADERRLFIYVRNESLEGLTRNGQLYKQCLSQEDFTVSTLVKVARITGHGSSDLIMSYLRGQDIFHIETSHIYQRSYEV